MNEPPAWAVEPFGVPQRVFARFLEQDSECLSYGVILGGERRFLKLGSSEGARESLSRAIALHQAVQAEGLVPLLSHQVGEEGIALLHPWVEAQPLYGVGTLRGGEARTTPGCAHARFRALPVPVIRRALDRAFRVLLAVAEAGFVSCDFYDGCVLFDFESNLLHLVDLDEFHLGPFLVEGERTLGSTRFMAPEEFVSGARIDQTTSVFHMARAASILLDEGDNEGRWRASEQLHAVALRGQRHARNQRYQTVQAFVSAWMAAS